MDELQRVWKRHEYLAKASTAFFYGILVSIAMNFFWEPGKIYSSGITGLSQLTATLLHNTPFSMSPAILILLFNIPLFILAWFQISHKFTIFTFMAVVFSSIMIKVIHPVTLTTDPIICAIFGGVVNGFGTGLALKYGISTGGLDIIGLTVRKRTGKSVGTVNIIFNIFIVIAAGFVFGWPHAFYSALSIFVNARIMDLVFTRQQKMQVIIITSNPDDVILSVQKHMRRGITIIHDAEGAYQHDKKTVLITVISRFEMPELKEAMKEADPKAFVSISENVHIMGRFYEPTI